MADLKVLGRFARKLRLSVFVSLFRLQRIGFFFFKVWRVKGSPKDFLRFLRGFLEEMHSGIDWIEPSASFSLLFDKSFDMVKFEYSNGPLGSI